jgi:hypothetical protein
LSTQAPSTFDEHVCGIVDEFLQTVVVVDDRALDSRSTAEALADEEGGAESAPGRARGVQSGLIEPTEREEHGFDPKVVTDAFAQQGLVCSLLSPDPEEESLDETFVRVARRADLVVMDWVLNRDEGRKTLKLIQEILASDERRRLRTIAVYTGQTDLRKVAKELAETIDAAYPDLALELYDDGLAMTKGPVRAAVFAKEHVGPLGDELEGRRVAFAALPVRLRSEFATLTTGLITGVALAALAALRDDTHRVLNALSPQLDPAYLGHRAALPDPDEAKGQVASLVAAELRSVIEDNQIEQHVALPILSLWLRDAKRNSMKFGESIDANKRLSLAQVEAMLEHGLGTDAGLNTVSEINYSLSYFRKTVKQQATKVFVADAGEAAASDAEFAHRMMMRTVYSAPPRTLQLGTIVHSDGVYRLCVQPLCDSVRLAGVTPFPFLPLVAVTPSDKADFVAADHSQSGWVYLKLSGNPSNLDMISFDPTPDASVLAASEDDVHSFTDTGGVAHRWICELKPDFAQRAAFELAQQFSRIAVDEAETFRLSR